MRIRRSRGAKNFSKGFATVFVVMSGMVVAGSVWTLFNIHQNVKLADTRDHQAQQMRQSVMHIDEMLTLAASVTAVTGDMTWQERYRTYEARLNSILPNSRGLGRPGPGDHSAEGQTSAATLSVMEKRVFELAREGRLEEARKILFSSEYETQKRAYADSIRWLTVASDQAMRLKDLWGSLTRHRKVLDTATQMIVVTGDPKWEESYQDFREKIYRVLAEIRMLSSDIETGKDLRSIEAANVRMMRMEDRIFNLMRHAHTEEARTILNSSQYEAQKAIYSEGMAYLAARITGSASPGLPAHRRLPFFYASLAAALVFAFLVGRLYLGEGKTRRKKPSQGAPPIDLASLS